MQDITFTKEDNDALIDIGYRFGLSVESYSGRYMHGKRCVSIVISNIGQYGGFLLSVAYESRILADYLTRGVHTDDMAYDIVVYWPGLPWLSDEVDDEDGDE